MKLTQKTIFVAFLLGCFNMISAQNRLSDPYGVNNGYGPTGYGRRGNIPMRDESKLSKKEQEKIQEETIRKSVDKLKTELNLDELQLIVISKTITESQKKQSGIIASENSREDKIAEIEALMENTDREVTSFLNNDQKEKYKTIVEERKKKFEKIKDRNSRN